MTQTNKAKEKIMLEFINDKGNKLRITPTELVEWINRVKEQQKQHEEVIKEINLENGQLETDIDKLRQENQQLKAKIKEMKQ